LKDTMIVSPQDRAHLRRAASLLTGVGWGDPSDVDPGVGLLCLAAAELLRPLVDHAAPALSTANSASAVDDALASLGSLSDDVFADEAVLEAADYARRVRALLG
jgi:hypothetical protein